MSRKPLLLVGVIAGLFVLSSYSLTGGSTRQAEASGTCSGTISMTPEISPGYDYLAISIQASGATGCTSPQYQFAFWNGSSREVFRDYSSSATAYWDTHNLTGTQYISIYAKDASSPGVGRDSQGVPYDTYTPWLSYSLTSHGYGDTYDDRNADEYLQNIDPQSDPENTVGHLTKWLSTYITLQPSTNTFATAGTPQCSGQIFSWQGAYAAGMPGNGVSGSAFIQPGFSYACSGQGTSAFAVSETTEAIDCPRGGAQNFGSVNDTILPNGSGVSASTTYEYKGCYVPASTLGLSEGSVANFDVHSVGSTLYVGVNGAAIFSAAESSEGMHGPWLDTELAAMTKSVGDQLNAGMRVHTAITQSWAYNDVTNSWFQLPNNAANSSYGSWSTTTFGGSGSVAGTGLYCDRPFGYYGGWNTGSPSSYLFAQAQYGHCGS